MNNTARTYNFALADSLHDMGPKMNVGAGTRAVVDETRPTTTGGSYVGKGVINSVPGSGIIDHTSEDKMLSKYLFNGSSPAEYTDNNVDMTTFFWRW